jgi:hypothetical protein
MKLKIYLITTLFILLSATFSQTIFAQTAKKQAKVLTQGEMDKREVTKFANSFVKSFLKIQDIRKMPEHFFAENFKTNFGNSNFNINDVESKGDNLSKLTPFEQNVLSANFWALVSAVASLKDLSKVKEDKFINTFPPSIVSAFKTSRLLRAFVDEDSKNDSLENEDNLSDELKQKIMQEYENDLSRISIKMRNHLGKFAEISSKNFTVNRAKQFKYYPADLCKAEKCLGLPENTPIFSIHEFMLCLRIAKIKNRLKIIQIYFVAMED